MIVKSTDLTSVALDFAVATLQRFKYVHASPAWQNKHGAVGLAQVMVSNKKDSMYAYAPSENWVYGGPILEEMLKQGLVLTGGAKECVARMSCGTEAKGATPLEAALRCLLVAEGVTEVDVPSALFLSVAP